MYVCRDFGSTMLHIIIIIIGFMALINLSVNVISRFWGVQIKSLLRIFWTSILAEQGRIILLTFISNHQIIHAILSITYHVHTVEGILIKKGCGQWH